MHGNDYAVVSDGCSNSGISIQTDWGARLLCKAVEEYRNFLRHPSEMSTEQFCKWVGDKAKCQVGMFPGLMPECLTATMILAQNDGLGAISTHLIGDGVVGARRRDGTLEVCSFEAISGAAFYPKYLWFEGEADTYFQKFGGTYRLTTYLVMNGETKKEVVETELDRDKPWFYNLFPHDEYDTVFIGSDGLSSFYHRVQTDTSKHNEPVPLMDVLGVLLDVNYRPGFLKLQRQWAFRRNVAGTFPRREWHNADDVSLAVLHHQQ